MGRAYGLQIEDDFAEGIKVAWREANQAIVQYWYALENAAIKVVQTGESRVVDPCPEFGNAVRFDVSGSFLSVTLPSGRKIWYPYPELREVMMPWGSPKTMLTYKTQLESGQRAKSNVIKDDPTAFGSWRRISTYGGPLTENITQAVARDLLAHSILALENSGMSVVMHVHDEVVVEIESLDDYDNVMFCMLDAPEWAKGLPLAAEGWTGDRYGKA
jgi:DNA polymerase